MSKKNENAKTKKKVINNIDYETIINNLSELKNIIIANIGKILIKVRAFLILLFYHFLKYNELKEKITKIFFAFKWFIYIYRTNKKFI